MNFSPRGVLYTKSKAFLKYFFNDSKYHQILRWAMSYPQPRVRKCVFLIIHGVPKTYSLSTPISIPSNKEKKSRYSYVIRMSVVCTCMSSICPLYVVLPWTEKNARNKSTFISTKHVQNVIKLKQNFLNNLFHYYSNFFHLSLGYC